ncbi:MAG: hypothetical protein L3J06_10210 [Cyclobacteriaceae bacterium]|nr:hypothetical protein [Cyclobacteriaceae bacterium]
MNSLHYTPNNNLVRLAKLNAFAQKMYDANLDNDNFKIMDITNQEVQDFLQSLYGNKVQYMLVGGVATVFHGHIRTTQDLNLWVKETPDNKKRLIKAFHQVDVSATDHYENVPMISGWSTVTIGDNGFVADLMGYMKLFKKEHFNECYKRARHGEFDGIPITVIMLNDLIEEKEKSARPKDLEDVKHLKIIQKKNKNKGLSM